MRIDPCAFHDVDDELVNAFAYLIPQLSSSNPPPSREQLTEMVQSPKNKHMLKVVEALTESYIAMYNNSCFLNLDMVVALEQNLAKLGRNYQWLSVQALNAGITNPMRAGEVRHQP